MLVTNKIHLLAFSFLIWGTSVAQLSKNKVEVYGNRMTSTAVILEHLNIEEGEPVDRSNFNPDAITSQVTSIPGVKHVNVELVCCDSEGSFTLYIGIAEDDSAILKFRPAPKRNVVLPNEVLTSYGNFKQQLIAAVQKGESAEDYINGYSLLTYPPARKEQMKFIVFANRYFPKLKKVLKYSRQAEQRAVAAQIIAYSNNKNEVAKYLTYAIQDADENVRNNATRALSILAAYLSDHPEISIRIPPDPLIRMLNSISWTDRNKASMVLAQLTHDRDSRLLDQIKKEALPSLVEMARWKNREHALFSYLILGRIAGEDENSLIEGNFSDNWASNTERMIQKYSL